MHKKIIQLNQILQIKDLTEAKRTTMSRVTRKSKINRAIGTLSTALGKKQNDPIYKKMMFHRTMYRKYKEMLMKKYKNRVLSRARR